MKKPTEAKAPEPVEPEPAPYVPRIDRLRAAHAEALADVEKAERALADAERAVSAAERAKESANVHTSDTDVKRLILDTLFANERLGHAQQAVKNAELAARVAAFRVTEEEESSTRRERHARGVQPILDLEPEARELEAKLSAIRQKQQAIFEREVLPRQRPWQRSNRFESVPSDVYESVRTILERHAGLPPIGEITNPLVAAQMEARRQELAFLGADRRTSREEAVSYPSPMPYQQPTTIITPSGVGVSSR